VREAAAAQGYPYQDIISGAGHDAVYRARVAPTAMVFVPCVGGISHNEIEDAKPADLTAGCSGLLNALLEPANATSPGEKNRRRAQPTGGEVHLRGNTKGWLMQAIGAGNTAVAMRA
jgi:hypothetical protein